MVGGLRYDFSQVGSEKSVGIRGGQGAGVLSALWVRA